MNRPRTFSAAIATLTLITALGAGGAFAVTPAAPTAGSTFDQRLAQRKQEQAITLSDNDRARLVSTCNGAQAKIRLHETDSAPKIATFTKNYQRIDARIWAITGQLKLANQDTFKLEKDRLQFADKVTNFQTVATNYQQVLDDLTVVNCQADPTGFQALLETARAYLGQLRAQATDIHSYVLDTIKPQLATHSSDLQQKTPNSGAN